MPPSKSSYDLPHQKSVVPKACARSGLGSTLCRATIFPRIAEPVRRSEAPPDGSPRALGKHVNQSKTPNRRHAVMNLALRGFVATDTFPPSSY